MREYIGIREATTEEVATYERVEAALGDLAEEAFDLICLEEMDDLLEDTIRGEELLSILAECGVSVAEACSWYFTEEC
jgi:hypothetical protein